LLTNKDYYYHNISLENQIGNQKPEIEGHIMQRL